MHNGKKKKKSKPQWTVDRQKRPEGKEKVTIYQGESRYKTAR